MSKFSGSYSIESTKKGMWNLHWLGYFFSFNHKVKLLGELKEKSVTEALSLPAATTPEAYHTV